MKKYIISFCFILLFSCSFQQVDNEVVETKEPITKSIEYIPEEFNQVKAKFFYYTETKNIAELKKLFTKNNEYASTFINFIESNKNSTIKVVPITEPLENDQYALMIISVEIDKKVTVFRLHWIKDFKKEWKIKILKQAFS